MTFLAVLVALLLQEGHAIALPTLWKARARFQDLKVYVHKDFNLTGNCSAEHPYTDTASRVVVGADSVLWPVRDWLWKHDEYISVELLMHLASCGLQRVSRAADADLCYPHCHNTKLHKWSGRYSGQMVEIKTATPHRFHDCKALQLHMEGAHPFNMERCHVVVPYFHGVYAPLKPLEPLRTPWNLVTKRDHFLSFFGGGKRGARASCLQELQGLAGAHKSYKGFSQFFTWEDTMKGLVGKGAYARRGACKTGSVGCIDDNTLRAAASFYQRSWELYAHSTFCWQPAGDTPTRRGFYDAWMFGCIPVVSNTSARTYGRLYGGLFWQDLQVSFRDVAVVLPDTEFYRGDSLFKVLDALSDVHIRMRQDALKRLAPYLQWSYKTEPNVLSAVVATYLHLNYSTVEPNCFLRKGEKACPPRPDLEHIH